MGPTAAGRASEGAASASRGRAARAPPGGEGPCLHQVTKLPAPAAHVAAVISSPNLGVLAVAAAGVLCAFRCVVDTLPEQCIRRRPVQIPLSLLFLELSGY